MRTSTFRDLLILLFIAACLLVAGYYLVLYFKTKSFDLTYELPIEQEEKLGDLMEDAILSNYSKLENEQVDSAIDVITKRLLSGLDSTHYRYQFRVIKSDDINAFTVPGGNIYIFSGLIKESRSAEEIAAVLAHEIGHAEKRHVVKKLLKEFSITAVVSLLAGGDPSIILQVLKEVVGTKFDREQEEEADQFGLQLLEQSRIDPENMAEFFEHLNEKDLTYNRNLEIVMTHPHNDSRIEAARDYRTKAGFQSEKIELDWKKVKGELN